MGGVAALSTDEMHDGQVTEPNEGSAPQGKPSKKRKRKTSPKAPAKSGGVPKPELQGSERYRIERELGRGAMGVVHLARDLSLDRDVAVKELTLAPGLTEERRAEMVERFTREAAAAVALDSDNVVRVLDSFTEGDRRFIVMEYLDGETLDALIAKGPLPADAAA